jgi:Carboxypeptidase regulatory-like domain
MTRLVAAALVVMIALVSRADATQRPATGIVRGRVVAADSDAPVRKARVALTPEGAPPAEPIYTNAEGEFAFTNVAPGRYSLTALKSGYVVARFGARSQFDRTTSIAVAAGAAVDGLELRLVKSAVITGRIVDEMGEPIEQALISAGRIVRTDGRLRFRSIGVVANTDDLGEYRISGLAAGRYALAISATGGGMAPRRQQTFYPGTSSLTEAGTLTLRPGEVAGAIDFAVAPVIDAQHVRLTGYVTDAAGSPVAARLQVFSSGNGVVASNTSVTMQLPATGEFTLQVEPGSQTLIAQSAAGIAVMTVGPMTADVDGLRLVLSRGGRVSGRVVFNGAAPPARTAMLVGGWSADLEDVRTSTTMDRPVGATPIRPDGTFAIEDLVGRRELRISNVPRGWTVTAILHNGRNLLNVPIDFKGGEDVSGVQIILTDQPTELTGLVVDPQQRPRADCSVLVFAEDRTFLAGRARWVRPDHTGRFRVEGLPAGTYLAAAVADVDDVEWSTVEYLDRLRSNAARVTLADAEKKTITLEWRP